MLRNLLKMNNVMEIIQHISSLLANSMTLPPEANTPSSTVFIPVQSVSALLEKAMFSQEKWWLVVKNLIVALSSQLAIIELLWSLIFMKVWQAVSKELNHMLLWISRFQMFATLVLISILLASTTMDMLIAAYKILRDWLFLLWIMLEILMVMLMICLRKMAKRVENPLLEWWSSQFWHS